MPTNASTVYGINQWKYRVKEFETKITNLSKTPRKNVWRPHRFCVRDVILGLVALRYNLALGYTEVDVCVSYDPYVFEDLSGTKIVTIFILSDAFMSGGSMEIHFTKNVEFGHVPGDLNMLARKFGVKLKHVQEGYISSAEAQELYFALTDLSATARSRAVALHNEGKVSLERVCFMVNNQTWLPEEMEMILAGAKRPENVILGSTSPLRRQLFMIDLFQASGPLLGTMFTRKILQKETVNQKGETVDVEFDEKRLTVDFDPRFYAKTYSLQEQIEVPWVLNQPDLKLPAGTVMTVMVRPRSAGHIYLFGGSDMEIAEEMAESNKGKGNWLGILYPEDFNFLDQKVKDLFVSKAREMKVNIIVCPEILETIDSSAIEKLRRSKLIRR